MKGDSQMKITVEALVKADLNRVWDAWNNPEDIKRWNAASEDWHTPQSTVDLREGGKFSARMEAKDGSAGFDFEGTYTRVVPRSLIAYRMDDGRECTVEFKANEAGVLVDGAGLRASSQGWRIKYAKGRKPTLVDGPFTETKELVAGYTIINVKSREEAIAWTKRFPNPSIDGGEGEIEVRPYFELDEFGDSPAADRARKIGLQ